jgi:hypothetical protein
MLSMNTVSRAGDGFPSSAGSLRHAKIAATTATVLLLPSSIRGKYHLRFVFASINLVDEHLRQYFPKNTDLTDYSQSDLNKVALSLNQRPRQTLGFQTPASKLQESVASTH